ncbi:uncharacterized protein BO95DRAFT_427319 [Aspergillus brunneoviolaceus CBS 621.78]|uniref:Uncharacterized protein n=1 Tax=Aspergillus brunneoviolaceus CBS 621.78 TaxID=1450534 RepID=A0ACD1GNX4_9EURO|nr:hypothetical protein BO95DRAFT_427319 [Aspergillus brunneoviolaceus CBS 621.78]RAH50961.1 hypothetical protein BO95DRAFT_427319 [Aspergillus brunneoviolaceus CBS 621.78]
MAGKHWTGGNHKQRVLVVFVWLPVKHAKIVKVCMQSLLEGKQNLTDMQTGKPFLGISVRDTAQVQYSMPMMMANSAVDLKSIMTSTDNNSTRMRERLTQFSRFLNATEAVSIHPDVVGFFHGMHPRLLIYGRTVTQVAHYPLHSAFADRKHAFRMREVSSKTTEEHLSYLTNPTSADIAATFGKPYNQSQPYRSSHERY